MRAPAAAIRKLFSDLLDKRYGSVYHEILEPWTYAAEQERTWLASLSSWKGRPALEPHDLERLYAFSRVNQLLLLSFQPGQGWHPDASRDEYVQFMQAMGLTIEEHPSFHPFYHEIVEVDQAPQRGASITIQEVLWPVVMLGSIVFSRGGVKVRGGADCISKEVAETSTLHWAYQRRNRPCHDMSSGWGAGSQWTTDERIDYRLDGTFHYNSAVRHPRTPRTARDRELLLHRCLITRGDEGWDADLYDMTLVEAS